MIEPILQQVIVGVDALRALGVLGALLFAAIYLLATLACVPATPLTAIAGFLYGPLLGTLLVSPVSLLSALLAFGITRYLARPWVLRRLGRHPHFAAVDQAMGQKGFRIALLLRLASIVPFAPLSCALGASRIGARDFLLASWLGLLPGTFLSVYLGSSVSDIAQLLRGQTPPTPYTLWLTWGGLVAALLALWSIARFARRAIHQSIPRQRNHEQTF
ncbi:TVP38/TMEM64 family protein [Variovorax sp. E3]|uniref:TVP38/TMEM64 family protein n=1 Tax=Variovorax sp. E3 TaxID=1914993 RepID=UPI0018DCCDF6|nr:TVP38/TMEM64 family protein [Variovorax sp. E3]